MAAQIIWSGLTMAALYSAVALCLYVTFAGTRVLNFAQGHLAVVGMFLMWSARGVWGWPLWLALLWTAVGGAIAGLILGGIFILPVSRTPLPPVLTSLGAAMAFEAVLLIVAGPDVRGLQALTPAHTYTVLTARITSESLWLVGTSILAIGGTFVLFRFTRFGRLLVANFQNALGSIIIGVSPAWILLAVVGLGGLLSALVGGVLAPIIGVRYDFGFPLVLKGFTAGVVGGMNRPTDPLVGGLMVGLVEAFTAGYISSRFADVVVFALIIVGLYLFPRGLASAWEGLAWRKKAGSAGQKQTAS